MSYQIIGCASRQAYGPSFDTAKEAYRYINDVLEDTSSDARKEQRKRSTSRLSFVSLPEPLFVADDKDPVEDQLPYLGKDKRLKEINDRHAWERAHKVREVLG